MPKAVKVLFPGLTHMGKMYNVGDIEKNPSDYLMDAARNKTKQYHTDSKKELRICKFVRLDDEGEYEEYEIEINKSKSDIKRTPVFVSGGFDDDLQDKGRSELITLASTLGMKKPIVKTIKDKNKLKEIIQFLRTI